MTTGYGTGVASVKVGVANVPQRLKDVPVSLVTIVPVAAEDGLLRDRGVGAELQL